MHDPYILPHSERYWHGRSPVVHYWTDLALFRGWGRPGRKTKAGRGGSFCRLSQPAITEVISAERLFLCRCIAGQRFFSPRRSRRKQHARLVNARVDLFHPSHSCLAVRHRQCILKDYVLAFFKTFKSVDANSIVAYIRAYSKQSPTVSVGRKSYLQVFLIRIPGGSSILMMRESICPHS
jgi:hypothetical protein